ncbi:flagellar motor protein MotB [Acetobacter sp.]|jgi:chemotaxis protein MotB|uniref:flagellar motor protein MotB n=1 Tax=Acetobacter sp. TaxID=440 RepID=UPI0025B8F559|nr:flagellar motor protein MotB [Acetobacter sp.]MCH4091321.1 OmpA family protein [Acetobacter sp.]MCI1299299.1 OmpA family protein [Acetobacter sp.]MCI1316697.1 OmpA family protein [Acetobacter sp.]
MPRKNGDNKARIIVVKRGGGGGAGHHGGAWKIAYADFVTAMMAFFLVMWLINATTEQRRRGIANFFNPMATTGDAAAQTPSGPGKSSSVVQGDSNDAGHASGADMSGQQAAQQIAFSQKAQTSKVEKNAILPPGTISDAKKDKAAEAGGIGSGVSIAAGNETSGAGNDVRTRGFFAVPNPAFPDRSLGKLVSITPALPRIVPVGGQKSGATMSLGDGGNSAAEKEEADLQEDRKQIEQALAQDPAAAQLKSQISVDVLPIGLRIQLAESNRNPMFETGSARLNERATHLLQLIAPYLTAMPQNLSIYGYTDGALYKKKGASNWTLSAARADSAREVLSAAGFPEQRLAEVVGRAAHDLADQDDPAAAVNRRVVLVLHREREVKMSDDTSAPTVGDTESAPAAAGTPVSKTQ